VAGSRPAGAATTQRCPARQARVRSRGWGQGRSATASSSLLEMPRRSASRSNAAVGVGLAGVGGHRQPQPVAHRSDQPRLGLSSCEGSCSRPGPRPGPHRCHAASAASDPPPNNMRCRRLRPEIARQKQQCCYAEDPLPNNLATDSDPDRGRRARRANVAMRRVLRVRGQSPAPTRTPGMSGVTAGSRTCLGGMGHRIGQEPAHVGEQMVDQIKQDAGRQASGRRMHLLRMVGRPERAARRRCGE